MMFLDELLDSYASPQAARLRRVLNAGCGPRSNRKLTTLFERTAWTEVRIDLDPAVDPDIVGSMTDMRAHFATASFDATAKVWDAATGEELFTLTGHTGPVVGVAFNHDGTRIATASWDETARVWDADTAGPCELVRFLVTTTELRVALGGTEPTACTNLRS